MTEIKDALENLGQSLKKLEDAVVQSTGVKREQKEKIENMQKTIQAAFAKMDEAINRFEQKEEE